ncbi:MAG: hypothetical protein ACFFD2_26575 [Promethearchaeota archaeon]
MKNKLRFLIYLLTILLFSFTALGENEIELGIYEYVYEYNTKSLIENHYIELIKKNGIIEGRYYGTSDDFDEAREGYLPGFFSAEMKNLQIKGNKISFEVRPNKFFNKAITPMKQNIKNSIWDLIYRYDKRIYHGTYHDGKIVIQSDGINNRVFVKIK